MNKIKNYLKLMRIKHWIKNILIFIPLLFSEQLFNPHKILICFIGFLSFSFVASSVYIINDLKDIEKDKKHPIKKNRPLASGVVSKKEGIILFIILNIISILLYYIFIKNLIGFILLYFYLFINILYSFGLKNIPILDVIILVSRFVIRMIFGASITNIVISEWLYLTVMSASFFMGFGKRRNEYIKQGSKSRNVLKFYNKDYLDKFMYSSMILTIVFYSLWSIDSKTILRIGNNSLIYTIPILYIIFMKYSLDIEKDSFGDPVDVIYSDKILLLLGLLFALLIFIIIYVL